MKKAKIIEARVLEKDRKPNKYYYELRHNDNSVSSKNLSVEKNVLVNFYGTLELDFELDFSKKDVPSYKDAISFKEFRRQEKEFLSNRRC